MPLSLLLAAVLLAENQSLRPPVRLPLPPLKGETQTVLIPSPPLSHFPAARPLMPLKATLRLDESAMEEREKQDLLSAINRERVRRGMGGLAIDPLLTSAALAHCREMCRLDYVEHLSPTPGLRTPMDRYLTALYAEGGKESGYLLVAENIFFCSETTSAYGVNYAHDALMASVGHRDNILEPQFTKVGVGLCRDAQGRYWVTEMFLRDAP